MGKYLDILKQAGLYDKNDIDDKSPYDINDKSTFGRINRFGRTFSTLQSRCPDHVPVDRWQQAVEDGKRFLAKWGSQAEALGWTSADLFGLHTPPEQPHPSYRRLSRYDCTGLVWLLEGRPVIALTADTAAIENPASITTYRRFNKPLLGPELPGDWTDTARRAIIIRMIGSGDPGSY
jgi:hypothetical protein